MIVPMIAKFPAPRGLTRVGITLDHRIGSVRISVHLEYFPGNSCSDSGGLRELVFRFLQLDMGAEQLSGKIASSVLEVTGARVVSVEILEDHGNGFVVSAKSVIHQEERE